MTMSEVGMTDGLVGYWKFNDDANDSSIYRNDGTFMPGSGSITDETFTSDYDVAVQSKHTNLTSDSEVVTTTDGGTTYVKDTDYTMDYPNGKITVLSTGGMADATDYYIDYSYSGSYPTYVDGISGKALEFDGVDDYVNSGNSASLRLTGDKITISAWVKADAFLTNPDSSTIVTKTSAYYLQIDGSGYIKFRPKSSGTYLISTNLITTGSYYYVVGTYEGVNEKIYINGIEDKTNSLTGNILDSANHVGIGMNLDAGGNPYVNYNRQFDGIIDDVRIYNRALTPAEIKILYNLYKPSGSQMELASDGNTYLRD